MLNVHFPSSLPINPEDLADLLRITGVPLTVEPLNGRAIVAEAKPVAKSNGATPVKAAVPQAKAAVAGVAPSEPPKRRGRPPKAAVMPKPAVIQGMVPTEPAKRRGRPPKAVVEQALASENQRIVPVNDEPVSTDDLLGRFSVLIDKSYEDALNLLGNFGVAKFSDLPETAFASFGKALGGLGV